MGSRTDTRQRLIEAAIVIIDDIGPGRLRLRDVAEAVGIKEPSVYKFFENRDALLVAAGAARYAKGSVELARRFLTTASQTTTRDDYYAAIRNIVSGSSAPEQVEGRAGRAVAVGLALSRADLAAQIRLIQAESNRLVAEGLRYGAERGWVRSNIPLEVFAHWMTGVVNSRVLLELDPEIPNADVWDALTTDAILTLLLPAEK
ncbi:MAG: TetR/AcrR family transcriptional regulator [Nitriliruptoraceae bacterium]